MYVYIPFCVFDTMYRKLYNADLNTEKKKKTVLTIVPFKIINEIAKAN